MEPLESHVLLVDNAGGFAVGAIDETFGPGQGKYVNTESGTGFSTGWTHVVAVA